MNAWQNIEVSPQDSEIIDLDNLEKTLGKIPANVRKIRELITRFEICHFKYQQHFENIKNSIANLKSLVEPNKIGAYHISKGQEASKKDKTGRSLLGQQYLSALMDWLGDSSQVNPSDYYNPKLARQITKWLGDKNPDKERLVRLLVARLTWNWKGYEEYQHAGKHKELEFQVCRMDICHFAFPQHLDSLLQGIGRMKPIKNFEGCGTFSPAMKKYAGKHFSILCNYLNSETYGDIKLKKNEKIKAWLTACLAKTVKEQVGLTKPITKLINLV